MLKIITSQDGLQAATIPTVDGDVQYVFERGSSANSVGAHEARRRFQHEKFRSLQGGRNVPAQRNCSGGGRSAVERIVPPRILRSATASLVVRTAHGPRAPVHVVICLRQRPAT